MRYHDDKTGADAELYPNGKLFVKGTGEGRDILQDLKIWPTFFKEVRGHSGAYEQAKYLLVFVDWKNVREIHGHSLGGAAALFLGLWTRKPVTTYGAFRTFSIFSRLGETPECTNYIKGWDAIQFLFPFRKKYGKNIRIKSKGFHPFKDHLGYGLSSIKE